MALPQFVAFKSKYNDKYLSYRHEGEFKSLHQFSGDHDLLSPYTKFEIQTAKTDRKLVHIRTCFTNKYWTTFSSNLTLIAAQADEPDEDPSQHTCTLFEPLFDDHHQAYRFRHVRLGYYLALTRPPFGFVSDCLYAATDKPEEDLSDLMTAVEFDSFMVLPKYVAFKGDNKCFVRAKFLEMHEFLEFSGKDIGDSTVGNEIFVADDGCVRIKSNHFGKFWRRSPNWIWADSSTGNDDNDRDTLFWPAKVDDNTVALRNLGNGNFCKRLTEDGKTDCLNAAVPTIPDEAKLKVEELVLSREIYDLNFRVAEARIFDQKIKTVTYDSAINNGGEKAEKELNLTYTDIETSTWSSSFSTKFSVKTTIKTGLPKIVEGKIEISAEFSGSYTWGKTETSDNKISRTFKVTVPSKKMVKVSMIATKGYCNVPFSYTQRDVLTNGERVVKQFDDGIFAGANCYSFNYKVDEYPL